MRNQCSIALLTLASLLMLAAAHVRIAVAGDEPSADTPLPAATTVWTCWTARSRIQCELDAAATPDSASTSPEEPLDFQPPALATGRVRSYQRPPIAKQLRDHPELLVGHRISIPAFGVPGNPLRAEELASSVICSDRADCHVTYLRSLAEIVLYQDARGDPALR